MLSRFLLRATLCRLTLLVFFSGSTCAAMSRLESAAQARQQLSLLAHRLQEESRTGEAPGKAQSGAYLALEKFARRHAKDSLGPLAALLLGHRDFGLARYAEAEGWFRQAALAWGGSASAPEGIEAHLGDYAEWYLAQSLAAQKNYEAAAETLADFPGKYPDSLLTDNAVEKRAAWLLEAGQAEKAIESLQAFRPAEHRPALLVVLARAYEAAHQLPQAAETYQRVYYGYPVNGEAATAAGGALARLETVLGENLPKVSTARRLARADSLYAARRWRQAEIEYEELARATAGAEKDAAVARLGGCFFQQEQMDRAIQHLAAFELADGPSEAERLFYLSQSYRALDLEKEMLAVVTQASARIPESPWHEEILFATGNYYLLKNNDAQATQFYSRVTESFPNGRYVQRARWKVAWHAYLSALPEASRLLREFIERYPNSLQVPDALYWLGRLAEIENYNAARPFYQALSRRFPHNYFSQDAGRRLWAAGWWVSAEPAPEWLEQISPAGELPDTNTPAPEAARVRWQRYLDLRLIALDDLAAAELRTASRLVAWPAILLELARDAHTHHGRTAEAFDALWRLYPDFFSRRMDEVPLELWRMLFPVPYEKLIRKWSKRHRLDPLLVAALIRQESAFAPQAVSSAGAVGLMQLMPATAKRLAGERRQRFRLSRLTDPDYNINYGCYYLAQLMKMFGDARWGPPWRGGAELALAAYNAGEEAVQHWLETRQEADAQTFVGNIPYSQTREYVQVILRNYKLYREIYSRR